MYALLFILGSSPGEDALLVYALVEFIDEECTAVVPMQCISNHTNVQAGDRVKVLWDNRKDMQRYSSFRYKRLNTCVCVLENPR